MCQYDQVQYSIDFEFELLKPMPDHERLKHSADVSYELDFAEVDADNKLPWSLPVNFTPYPCLSKYICSWEGGNSNLGITEEKRKGYHIYSPVSIATAAMACLEPLVYRVEMMCIEPSPL